MQLYCVYMYGTPNLNRACGGSATDLFIEMYDLDTDPHQLHNLAQSATPEEKAALHAMAVEQFVTLAPLLLLQRLKPEPRSDLSHRG